MSGMLRHTVTRAWAVLAIATVLVFALAENDAPARVATVAIVLIAAFKIRLVFLHFMELADGAMPWRAVLEGWVALVTLLIAGLYCLTPA